MNLTNGMCSNLEKITWIELHNCGADIDTWYDIHCFRRRQLLIYALISTEVNGNRVEVSHR